MRRLRGSGLGFAAALVMLTSPTSALADVRLFTFPDPAIVVVRAVAQKIELLPSPRPLFKVMLPTTYPAGTQFRIQGNLAALSGPTTTVIISEPAASSYFSLTANGAFDQTITLTASADYFSVFGMNYTTAEFTSLTIDEVI